MIGRGNLRNGLLSGEAPITYDVDAQPYVDQIQIVEGVSLPWAHRNAINNLVKRMKGLDSGYSNYGSSAIWNARILFCPNLGNSLATTKYNLFSPQDTDGAKRQVYFGGVTYDSGYGVKGNGTNGRIRSFVHQRYDAGLDPTSAVIGGVYKSNSLSGRMDWGTYSGSTSSDSNMWLRIINSGAVSVYLRGYTYDVGPAGAGPVTQAGHWCVTQTSTPNIPQLWYNKTKIYEYGGSPSYSYLNESREYSATGANGELTFLCLNYQQGSFVNFTSNTLILYYVMKDLGGQIGAWNQIIEDFCIETGRKTW